MLPSSKKTINIFFFDSFSGVVHEHPRIGSDGESEEGSRTSEDVVSPANRTAAQTSAAALGNGSGSNFSTFCSKFSTFCLKFSTFCSNFSTFCSNFSTFCSNLIHFCSNFITFCSMFCYTEKVLYKRL